MRFIAVLRVSTRAQADSGFGLEAQEAAVRAWAKANRHRLLEVVIERGVSGSTPVDKRPELVRALRDLADARVDGIVVPRLDRLARDLVVQEQLIAEAQRLGGRIASANPTEDDHLLDADPQRVLVRQILGAIAQYDRAMIRARLRDGRERKRARGGYAAGRPPYGWIAVAGRLVPVPAEQVVRRRIKDMRARGASYRQIADKLNAEKIPAKDGGTWQPYSVSRIANSSAPNKRRTAPLEKDSDGGEDMASEAS